jgi:hypothetical protein
MVGERGGKYKWTLHPLPIAVLHYVAASASVPNKATAGAGLSSFPDWSRLALGRMLPFGVVTTSMAGKRQEETTPRETKAGIG